MRLKVYTASKLAMAEEWIALRKSWFEFEFTARWPDISLYTDDAPASASVFWQIDLADIARADGVLLYGREGEHLRGGLVEAGAALATGKWVVVVGDHPDYGTWQYYPNVHHAASLDDARNTLKLLWRLKCNT